MEDTEDIGLPADQSVEFQRACCGGEEWVEWRCLMQDSSSSGLDLSAFLDGLSVVTVVMRVAECALSVQFCF